MKLSFVAIVSAALLVATNCVAQEKERQVFGFASSTAVQIITYGKRPVSWRVTYSHVTEVPGFEGCKVVDLLGAGINLVCGKEKHPVNAQYTVGSCSYTAVYRNGGLGFDKKATWDAWLKAARACGADEKRLQEIRGRKTTWAKDDIDPRYKK